MPRFVTRTIELAVPEAGTVTAKVDAPATPVSGAPALVLAHGANNDLDNPLLSRVAEHLAAAAGSIVLRFNFPYVERGDGSRDSAPVLESSLRCAHDHLRQELVPRGTRLFAGGKSLGGRVAAELVSRRPEGDGIEVAGLIELGYPLHAPGRKDRINVKPLRHVDVPSLFCVGSRDAFCDLELLRPVLPTLSAQAELLVVDGGDHSLLLPRASGREPEAAYPEVAAKVATFIQSATP
jgi:predicted alpha/beta-hydrolase family hydrolase